ncbi:MAG: aldolase/citrate lyase family protein [Chloroflexi bacterium]|nr:aldolase/citrate lyase family protein [Chloroflexota bacterium]
MIASTIIARNLAGKKARSLNLTYPAQEAVELAHRAGFDAIHLDGEHGAFSPPDIDRIVATAHMGGMSVTCRPRNFESTEIIMWLDRGIQGIMAPHVETGEQAESLVEACYFDPRGHRSWGTHRGTEFNDNHILNSRFGGRKNFTEFANDNMLVFAQVESHRGYENLDDILAVDGLTAITYGHFDLALSMHMPGEGTGNPEIDRIQAEMEVRARAAGKGLMSDYFVMVNLQDIIVESGREFVGAHAEDRFPG